MEESKHPRHDLDSVLLTSAIRLSIMTILDAQPVRYTVARDTIEVTDAVLSHELAKLVKAGYVEITRSEVDKRYRWLALTATGRAALSKHADALRRILEPDRNTEHS